MSITDTNLSANTNLSNEDLAPVPPEKRSWSLRHYTALWIGMCICIPSYMIASSLIQGGMNLWQALLTVFLGNTIVLIPMVLNGHVGVKYGIPFPVYARISFGVLGANIPALLRAVVACGWFGIQCWIGGSALHAILLALVPSLGNLPPIFPTQFGTDCLSFSCFLVFWGINVFLIAKGVESIKKLEAFCAPLLILCGIALLFWAFTNAPGLLDEMRKPDQFTAGKDFFSFFIPALTGMVGYWATLSLNIPDFTRYAVSQRDQILGQTLGLPTTMTFIAFIGITVTLASGIIYGHAIWDPVQLIAQFKNPLLISISMGMIALATLAMNVAANVVAPANDFSNLWPSRINFKRGGFITALIGLCLMPWKLIADPSGYIFTWLVGYSGLLGPVTGILLSDYFLIKKTTVSVADLYQREGAYTYQNGVNVIAILALLLGVLPCLPGFLTQIQALPKETFPEWLNGIYQYAWFAGLSVGSLTYIVGMRWQERQALKKQDIPQRF